MRQEIAQLPRIPDGYGHMAATQVHVFIIHVVNSGLISVTLNRAGLIGPDGKSLTHKFYSERHDKQFPLELAPGDGLKVHTDAYDVLQIMKGNGFSGRVTVQGYMETPLKQYKSKKVHIDTQSLSNEINRIEGAWRKAK